MMKIIKKVRVKQVLTEHSKQQLYDHFLTQKMQLEQECEQLQFGEKKVLSQNKSAHHKLQIQERFKQEKNTRLATMEQINFKINQLAVLPIGSEIVEKEVDALVDVQLGMSWDEVMGEATIVFEDEQVVRIENSR